MTASGKRVPAGVPTGGQFTLDPNTEADLHLYLDDLDQQLDAGVAPEDLPPHTFRA